LVEIWQIIDADKPPLTIIPNYQSLILQVITRILILYYTHLANFRRERTVDLRNCIEKWRKRLVWWEQKMSVNFFYSAKKEVNGEINSVYGGGMCLSI